MMTSLDAGKHNSVYMYYCSTKIFPRAQWQTHFTLCDQYSYTYGNEKQCKPSARVILRMRIMYIHVRTCNGEYAEIAHAVLVDAKR